MAFQQVANNIIDVISQENINGEYHIPGVGTVISQPDYITLIIKRKKPEEGIPLVKQILGDVRYGQYKYEKEFVIPRSLTTWSAIIKFIFEEIKRLKTSLRLDASNREMEWLYLMGREIEKKIAVKMKKNGNDYDTEAANTKKYFLQTLMEEKTKRLWKKARITYKLFKITGREQIEKVPPSITPTTFEDLREEEFTKLLKNIEEQVNSKSKETPSKGASYPEIPLPSTTEPAELIPEISVDIAKKQSPEEFDLQALLFEETPCYLTTTPENQLEAFEDLLREIMGSDPNSTELIEID